jgi:ABC-type sugar transport system substrate-binding protein
MKLANMKKEMLNHGSAHRGAAACIAFCLLGAFCCGCRDSAVSEKRPAEPLLNDQEKGEIHEPKAYSFRVAVFTPHKNTFWDSFIAIMVEAARDLGISLEFFQAADSRERMKRQVLSVVKRQNPPDYIVFQNFKGMGPELAAISEQNKVPFFVVNAALDTPQLGLPRQRNKYWLGQMSPDDVSAGENVAQALVEAARSKGLYNQDGVVEMVAISGVRADVAGRDRENGLRQMLAKSPEVKLHQLVNGDWAGQVAGQRIEDLLRRYPTTKVVWAADESIAMATALKLKELGRQPGKDILVGSVDWASREMLMSMRMGEIEVAEGGHFTEGAWVAVLLFDYHRGLDFADYFLEIRTSMIQATPGNVDKHLKILHPDFSKSIDFKQMTRPSATQGYRYAFCPESLFKLIPENKTAVHGQQEAAP